jgi:hypothetical protein
MEKDNVAEIFRVKKYLLPNAYPFSFVNSVTCRKSRTKDLERRSDAKPFGIVSIP